MLRIRKFQLAIENEYHKDEMKTPIHLYIGQEAIAVGICANLNPTDYISSNHRSHGHYLAKGGDMNALAAELFCRKTGCSKGRGGSMHLVDVSVSHFGSSSIVGGGIPIGTGHALAAKMKRNGCVSVVFFGDGAHDEGVLYESINFAILKKLPVIFVLENNHFSVCSRTEYRWGTPSPFLNYDSNVLWSAKIDGNDISQVFDKSMQAITRARSGNGPSFIECVTYRMRGHAGTHHDAHLGYRNLEEITEWEGKDPIVRFRNRLSHSGLSQNIFEEIEERVDTEVRSAFAFAKTSALPDETELGDYLFCEI